jgi:hypothetical protein
MAFGQRWVNRAAPLGSTAAIEISITAAALRRHSAVWLRRVRAGERYSGVILRLAKSRLRKHGADIARDGARREQSLGDAFDVAPILINQGFGARLHIPARPATSISPTSPCRGSRLRGRTSKPTGRCLQSRIVRSRKISRDADPFSLNSSGFRSLLGAERCLIRVCSDGTRVDRKSVGADQTPGITASDDALEKRARSASTRRNLRWRKGRVRRDELLPGEGAASDRHEGRRP